MVGTRVFSVLVLALTLAACGSSKDEKTPFPGPSNGGGAQNGTGGTSGGGAGNGTGGLLLGTGGAAPACKNTGEACASASECCEGNTCNNTAGSAELNGCRLRCTQNSDCQSGCCVLFENDKTRGICGDAKWCACGTQGSACSSQLPPCCTDHVCLGNQAQTAYACAKKCSVNTDCSTNCCVSIPGLGGQSACLGPEYCPAP